jgi:hypothetical protein
MYMHGIFMGSPYLLDTLRFQNRYIGIEGNEMKRRES